MLDSKAHVSLNATVIASLVDRASPVRGIPVLMLRDLCLYFHPFLDCLLTDLRIKNSLQLSATLKLSLFLGVIAADSKAKRNIESLAELDVSLTLRGLHFLVSGDLNVQGMNKVVF